MIPLWMIWSDYKGIKIFTSVLKQLETIRSDKKGLKRVRIYFKWLVVYQVIKSDKKLLGVTRRGYKGIKSK